MARRRLRQGRVRVVRKDGGLRAVEAGRGGEALRIVGRVRGGWRCGILESMLVTGERAGRRLRNLRLVLRLLLLLLGLVVLAVLRLLLLIMTTRGRQSAHEELIAADMRSLVGKLRPVVRRRAVLAVIARIVARVEARPPPGILLLARAGEAAGDGILDGRDGAVAALVIASKRHGGF